MKYRLRSNAREELETDNIEQILNSFELKFRGVNNEPYLQLPDSQRGFVECVYIQNTPENLIKYHPKIKGCNNVLFVTTNKNGEESIALSGYRLEDLQNKPCLENAWFAIDCSLHKDYLTLLACRQAQQKEHAEQQAKQAMQRYTDTLTQIEQLKQLAIDSGLTLALDYISSPDDEE